MKYLYDSLSPFSLGGTSFLASAKTDGEKIYIKVTAADNSGSQINGSIGYNGEVEYYTISGGSYTAAFDYSDSVKTARLTKGSSSKTLSWRSSINDPDPTVSIGYTGVRINSFITTTFDYSASHGHCALVCPKMYYSSGGRWELIDYTAEKHTGNQYSYFIFGGNPPGTLYKYVLLFAEYENSGDSLENYVGLREYTLPVFTLTAAGTPFAPCGLSYGSGYSGQPLDVSWNAVNDPEFTIDRYIVNRTVNGTTETEVYRGTSPHFTDTTPVSARTVSYDVYSESDGVRSAPACGDTVDLISSNIHVCADGQIRQAAAVYIGVNGEVVRCGAHASVGA